MQTFKVWFALVLLVVMGAGVAVGSVLALTDLINWLVGVVAG